MAIGQAADLVASPRQAELTERLVKPRMPTIIEAITRARKATDAFFSLSSSATALAATPEVSGDSNLAVYPLGFCASIRDRVYAELGREPCIQELRSAGVTFSKVFVILRNSYFQNAIQLGNLYLDTANDTVDASKHFFEWQAIPDLSYRNLEAWPALADVAERYYSCQVFLNIYFPLLAPLIPLMAIRDNGRLDLLFFQNLFFLKDLREGLPRLSTWLKSNDAVLHRRLPQAYQDLLVRHFSANDFQKFPFEFRTDASLPTILAQAREIAAASRHPQQEKLVVKLLEIAPQAVTIFRRLGINARR
ncbi:MAG TPA: hypothetical protein VMF06_02070 [Candidatus Limnocylindria bacterium]|jgi:hypothetical protein|nr:hypothetical protein [Candidatus Limnocylindria bacterium]